MREGTDMEERNDRWGWTLRWWDERNPRKEEKKKARGMGMGVAR